MRCRAYESMQKNRLKSLSIRNLLSFGADSPEVQLGNLNVLIGPNGSGKSNLIEIIGLLRSTPKELTGEIRDSGGVAEWLWKGQSKTKIAIATVERRADLVGANRSISYRLSFTRDGSQLRIVDERIEKR